MGDDSCQKRMSPRALEKLQTIADFVTDQLRGATSPADIIRALVRDHGASHRPGASTNVLRAAGVSASCTWSKDEGLLSAWRRLATVRIMGERA